MMGVLERAIIDIPNNEELTDEQIKPLNRKRRGRMQVGDKERMKARKLKVMLEKPFQNHKVLKMCAADPTRFIRFSITTPRRYSRKVKTLIRLSLTPEKDKV